MAIEQVIGTEAATGMAEVENKGNEILAEAKRLAGAIVDDVTFSEAGHFRVAASREMKARKEFLEPARKTAYEAYQEVLKLIKKATAPFDQALEILDKSIGSYSEKQEQMKREEQERLRKEAQKQAEDAALAAATEADKAGDHDRAAAILEQPIAVATPEVAPVAKVEGMSTRENWKVDPIINIRTLCQAIANGKASIECVMPNMPVLNRMAKALKGSMQVPGVTVVREKIVASTRG